MSAQPIPKVGKSGRPSFTLFKAEHPTADGSEYVGMGTLWNGMTVVLEARVVDTPGFPGRKHFEGRFYDPLLRHAKVSANPAAIPDDLVARMEAPFDDEIPPQESTDES